jgi:hypothetical protein
VAVILAATVFKLKEYETMKTITSGKDNKVVYMPYEATGILSSVDGIKQMFDKG